MEATLRTVGRNGSAAASRTAHRIVVETSRAPAFYDVTDQVADAVRSSGVHDGVAVVFSRHTTAAIRINEHETQLLQDMEDFLKRIAPRDAYYRHNDFTKRVPPLGADEPLNGHAHCGHLLLSASEMVPIENGELLLGTWQRIFLVELDSPRRREVVVQTIRS